MLHFGGTGAPTTRSTAVKWTTLVSSVIAVLWASVAALQRGTRAAQPKGATGITAYLANGGALEHAQAMAAHESPRTTKLYDRTKERLTQDEVESIML
jgi:hypothetical protein